jgi:ketosteroid isomerase-like protein
MSAPDVVRRFYDAVVRRDLGAARGLLSDRLVFEGLFETYPDADAYLKALTGLLSITTRLEVRAVFGEGEHAAVFFDLDTKAPVEAKTFVAEWHRVRDGRIVWVKSAFDGRAFAKMFGAG